MICRMCPRNCGVDRSAGIAGFCMETDEIRLARAALHYWEEPCISGVSCSGSVFFSGCNMRCVFCQNAHIASGEIGRTVSVGRLSEIFLELQEQGANNINLVTPSHYVPQIREALLAVRGRTLHIPVVYNSSAYESPETLRLLDGLVDIYLPDFKYWSGDLAAEYSKAPDYRERAQEALEEMYRQTDSAVIGEDGLMKRGMIVRHLVLPGSRKDSMEVVRYLYETYGDNIYISILNQYTPMPDIKERCPKLARKVTTFEYDSVRKYAMDLGVVHGFTQTGDAVGESFIPAFDYEGVERKA